MLTLRQFQADLVDRIRAGFRQHRRLLLVSPTGSGKTVMFCYLSSRVAERRKRITILVHREELIDQISNTLADFHIRHGVIAATSPRNYKYEVQIASVFTLVRRLGEVEPPHLLVVDEAHHAIGTSTWGRVMTTYKDALTLGVTATPQRLSGEGLGESFDELLIGPTVRELIALNYLADYRLFIPPGINMEGAGLRAGDFIKGELVARADKPTVTGDAIEHYRKHCQYKPAVAFCVSVEHAKHVASQFRGAGFNAVAIDGGMDRGLRRDVMRDFRAHKIHVMASCELISEGFDVPGIHAAILLRPTQSLALYMQQVGRALRPAAGKQHAIILDHANNALRHGLPDEEREWTLAGRPKGLAPADVMSGSVRVCPKCYAAVLSTARSCSHCGMVFAVSARKVEQVDGELVEIEKEQLQRARRQEQVSARTYEDLVALGKSRGYKNPAKWALHVYNARQAKRGAA